MSETERGKEDLTDLVVSYSKSEFPNRIEGLFASFASYSRCTHVARSYDTDDLYQDVMLEVLEMRSKAIVHHHKSKDIPDDDLKKIIRNALDKALAKTEENKVKAILDSCMAEIDATRERRLRDQEDIERFTTEARTILTQLQTA